MKTQGMGTVVRRNAPNGEVPRPLRSLCVFVETSPVFVETSPESIDSYVLRIVIK